MTWYGVRLVMRSTIDGISSEADLFEESIRVILADSAGEAAAQAEELGHSGAHEYRNDAQQLVRWELVRVAEVQELDNVRLTSGDEVFSRLCVGDPDSGTSVTQPGEEETS